MTKLEETKKPWQNIKLCGQNFSDEILWWVVGRFNKFQWQKMGRNFDGSFGTDLVTKFVILAKWGVLVTEKSCL